MITRNMKWSAKRVRYVANSFLIPAIWIAAVGAAAGVATEGLHISSLYKYQTEVLQAYAVIVGIFAFAGGMVWIINRCVEISLWK